MAICEVHYHVIVWLDEADDTWLSETGNSNDKGDMTPEQLAMVAVRVAKGDIAKGERPFFSVIVNNEHGFCIDSDEREGEMTVISTWKESENG